MKNEFLNWKKFPATHEDYEDIRDYIIDAASNAGISDKRLLKLELGIEEVIVNVISYAYEDNSGVIFINVTDDKPNFIIEIADYGVPFNPLETNDPRAVDTSEIQDRKVGGFGIAFIKKIFVEMTYSYKLFDGKQANYLKLVFQDSR